MNKRKQTYNAEEEQACSLSINQPEQIETDEYQADIFDQLNDYQEDEYQRKIQLAQEKKKRKKEFYVKRIRTKRRTTKISRVKEK